MQIVLDEAPGDRVAAAGEGGCIRAWIRDLADRQERWRLKPSIIRMVGDALDLDQCC
jgi:hypothetical protein